MTKQTAIVVCPGRGTYGASELGYLSRYHSDQSELIAQVDAVRAQADQPLISDIDAASNYSFETHGTGDHASALIYTCAMADFAAINRDRFDIVGVTGNSMGWYLALAASGALSISDGARLVNSMGTLMAQKGVGGQIVYPIVDEDWKIDPNKLNLIDTVMVDLPSGAQVYTSIRLGGMVVLAANKAGLAYLMKALPKDGHFPFALRGHAAFHSPLLSHIIPQAQANLTEDHFNFPDIPMIDGEGHIWSPFSAVAEDVIDYTLGRQINQTFDFSKAIEVCAKEFAPDVFIVLGPGTTLGAPVAQSLIAHNFYGLEGKKQFKDKQMTSPVILSMGIEAQRKHVVS